MQEKDCKFSKEHEWVWLDGEGKVATVGISTYAAEELGDIVFVELPEVGREVEAMDVVGTIEAVKTVADFYCPISGRISAVNADLEASPELVNESPHEKGWMLRVEVRDTSELEGLLSHEDYLKFLGESS
jgi:glycine cleavage system H protein